jgi:predicted ThiF/HesA family dinucleotide-utilizing enzyme
MKEVIKMKQFRVAVSAFITVETENEEFAERIVVNELNIEQLKNCLNFTEIEFSVNAVEKFGGDTTPRQREEMRAAQRKSAKLKVAREVLRSIGKEKVKFSVDNHKTTECYLPDNHTAGYAFLSIDDEFVEDIGKAIAFLRAAGLEIPQELLD